MEIIDNDREFTVALIPEQYHSVPSAACLHLPATNAEIMDAIDRARTGGVPSYIEVRSMKRSYLKDCLIEYPNLYELNLLARKLEEMSSGDETLYKAMLKRESKPIETARLINLTYNLEQCVVAPVSDYDALGRFAVDNGFWDDYNGLPDEILSILDYDQLGRKFHKEQEGDNDS